MKQLYPGRALCALILTAGLIATASADTVNARCDIYPAGEDKA